MSYLIRRTDGTLLAEVQPQAADVTATPLTLIGQAYTNYGAALNDNLVKLLENFSAATPPSGAMTGMLWYNPQAELLSLLDVSGNWDGLATRTWSAEQFVRQADGVVYAVGDATGTASNGTLPLTLAATGVVAGTYSTVVINSKGLVTSTSPDVDAGSASIGTFFLPTLTAYDPNTAGQVWAYNGVLMQSGGKTLPAAAGRNLIHNSMFRINQRGTASVTSTNSYPADRWVHFDSGSGSRNLSLVALTDADRTALGNQPQLLLGDGLMPLQQQIATVALRIQTTGTGASGDYELVQQRIEDVRSLCNRPLVLSFFAKASTEGQSVATEFFQSFGNGGGSAIIPLGLVTLTTDWTRYYFIFTSGSSDGVTFGTAGTDYSAVDFWTSSGSANAVRASNIGVQSSDIQIWGVQLEVGTGLTPIEHPRPQTELLDCRRFFQIGVAYNLVSTYTQNCVISATYNGVPMRTVPTLTLVQNSSNYVTIAGVAALNNESFLVYGTAPGAPNNVAINVAYAMDANL